MTTINTIEELIELLHTNPQWADELRKALLTEDLQNLPAEFRSRAQRLEEILESNQQVLESNQRVLEGNQRVLEGNQILLKQLVTASANATSRMDRMEQDRSTLKNLTTRIQSSKYAPALAADLNLTFRRSLQPEELAGMAAAAGLTGAQRRSFIQADLVILSAEPDSEQDQPRYIVAEVSYTGAPRDTVRALRNAAIIARVTGVPCEAALASVRNDDEVDQQIREGLVHWYQVEERDLDNAVLGGN